MTASPRHCLLVRRHLRTGELAFHYCFTPDGPCPKTRLITAAGLRWPVEEGFEFAKGSFGLDQCQARLYTAILRHTVLVMAALAICAVTAAQLKARTSAQAPPPASPGQAAPADAGLTPLSVHDVKRLLGAALRPPRPICTLLTGSAGDAATRHDHDGSTNAPAWHATTPWSASNWRLPY